jgi:uncharacterized repeat protein (TIGR03843 family)
MPADQRPSSADELIALAAQAAHVDPEARLAALGAGRLELVGRLADSSNQAFVVVCEDGSVQVPAVYKPLEGERPLWDFPPGIHRREVAAYLLSELLGLGLVPETLERLDAPLGPGSLQRFVPADFTQHYFTLIEQPEHHPRLADLAGFDVVANNADRKAGHVLAEPGGTLWAIDNGLCFHAEPKLRTVIWEFAGHRLSDELSERLGALVALLSEPGRARGRRARLLEQLDELLAGQERAALLRRARTLLARGCLPAPDARRRPYPWPLV